MPTETEIQTERERLYDSAALREDINDDEATVLLEWGEKHVVRLGQAAADSDDLEQKARFLRQLLKNINRFVGQRQYNDRAGQLDYMEKVVKWLANPTLGFKNHTADELLDKLPFDTKDMAATLKALLDAIDPGNPGPRGTPDAPPQDRLGALKDAVSQSVQGEEKPGNRPNPGPRGKSDASPEDRLGALRDAVSQSVQGDGQSPHRPNLHDAASQSAHQQDPHSQPILPVPEDARQSVLDQLEESRREKPDAYRPQPDVQADAPSLLDTLRQAVTNHLEHKMPEKDNSALDTLREAVEKTQDEDMSSGDGQSSNRSPHSQSSAEHQKSSNRPHKREEDEDNGKTTKQK